MPARTVMIRCVVCNVEYEIKMNYQYKIRKKSGLFYCSKECTWSEVAKKVRYEHQCKIMKQKYGYENAFQNPDVVRQIQNKRNETEITKKKIETFRMKYGVENAQQIEEVREKTSRTNLIKYGVVCSANSKENLEKRKRYLVDNFGVDYYFQTDEFKEKMKKTMLERYGTETYFKFGSAEFKNRILELYGVTNVMHVPEIAEKVLDGYRGYYNTNKFYILPSGKKVRIQGYENKTFDKLFSLGYDEIDILWRKSDMPAVWYFDENGVKRRYYPDFYIPGDNLIIETKSSYTLYCEKNCNKLKFDAVKSMGFNFKLDVY